MKTRIITPVYVDFIPEQLQDHQLYISDRYRTAIHKCCCGCGEEVVTPLTPADWSVIKHGNTVSLTPSIGNWSFDCKSHYLIRRNRVVWAGSMSDVQIQRVKAKDKTDKAAYIATVNRQKQRNNAPMSWILNLWDAIKRLWPF